MNVIKFAGGVTVVLMFVLSIPYILVELGTVPTDTAWGGLINSLFPPVLVTLAIVLIGVVIYRVMGKGY